MQAIHVYPDNRLVFNGKTYRCALGLNGMIAGADHREGDKCTPAGDYPIRAIWYRADRITLPPVNFPVHEITRADGWCDAPEHPQYNQHVTLPFAASHETLWHDNHSYDIIVVIGQNDAPVVPYLGSAIFFHIAAAEYTPTAGCVAISQPDMLAILPQLAAGARMHIHAAA